MTRVNALLGATIAACAASAPRDVACDIVIAGGSLAGTAAAVASANTSSSVTVCYLDITDWPGGQATASGTSAIDWGMTYYFFPYNLDAAFALLFLGGEFGDLNFNPGGCQLSTKCFPPAWIAQRLLALMATFPNIKVFLQTAVTGTTIDPITKRVIALSAVQRTPTPAFPGGYARDLSAALDDWYSPDDSTHFTKEALTFSVAAGGVAIEATEFGDVLMTAALPVAQGIETPRETAVTFDDHCGQATTVCFWLTWADAPVPEPDPAPPGNDGGYPFPIIPSQEVLNDVLVWRRSLTGANTTTQLWPHPGDTFLVNSQEGNDLLSAQVFLPLSVARAQAPWRGGLNLTALAMAEQRAYGFYHQLKRKVAQWHPAQLQHTLLDAATAGTTRGLAKMPYLRESRRALHGIQGFRLCSYFAAVNGTGPGGVGCSTPKEEEAAAAVDSASVAGSDVPAGFRWMDTVGIGQYGFDIHKFNSDYCTYPPYLNFSVPQLPALPYYLPFRALTVDGVPNLLVAGKNMAQTFFANSATREHPTEWASGTAAGTAAAYMVTAGLHNTTQVYQNFGTLQYILMASGAPLDWILPI